MSAEVPGLTVSPITDARAGLLAADPIPWVELWPALKLLSCWSDAGAAFFIPGLRRRFPRVMLQGKGLLATEAPVTIPLIGASGPVPLVDEIFLEFEDAEGSVFPLQSVRNGEEYSLIVSQRGGLARYRTHDRVQIDGYWRATPCLRFIGRDNQVSDLVGEKLQETFVRGALERAFGGRTAAFLVPVRRDSSPSFYVCVTERCDRDLTRQAERLESLLLQAFQYRQARQLDQLGPVRVLTRADARDRYEKLFLARGDTWGDIKYTTLLVSPRDHEIQGILAA